MKKKKRSGSLKMNPFYQDGGAAQAPPAWSGSDYAKNNFFNRLFNRNNILEEQIRNEYQALKQIPLRKMHVDYAGEEDAATMEQLEHNPEYIHPDEGVRQVKLGNVTIPKGKMLVNYPYSKDSTYPAPIDFVDPRFVTVRYPGHHTTLINRKGLSRQKIKGLATNDFVSHVLHDDPVYESLSQDLERLLIEKMGDENVQNNGGVDAYIRSLISDEPEYAVYRQEMAAIPQSIKDKIINYVKRRKKLQQGGFVYPFYQTGGERNLPAPDPIGSIPMLPVITDPREFARLYGTPTGRGSDLAAGVPSRTQMEEMLQRQLAEEAIRRQAVQERKRKSPVSHIQGKVPQLANPDLSAMGKGDGRVVRDATGLQYGQMTDDKVAQWEREQDQLYGNLIRLGYSPAHAAAFTRKGRGRLQPFLQEQLDKQEHSDFRVRHHPDYNPRIPIEEQQGLNYDNSLRARELRGMNMLLDSGNPLVDAAMNIGSSYGQLFTEGTMNSDSRYVKPGFLPGALNLATDILSLIPGERLAGALVNRATPRALSYMVNPAVQGVEDFGRWYIPKVAGNDWIAQRFPEHATFALQANKLMGKGVPFNQAVKSSYRRIGSDNYKGMNLTHDESPREIYRQMMEAQDELAPGSKWINPSYSADSYPLTLEYLLKRLDPKKYEVVPTYGHTPLNAAGFKSHDVVASLPDGLKFGYKKGLDQIKSLKQAEKDLYKQRALSKDAGVQVKLGEAIEQNSSEARGLATLLGNQLLEVRNSDPRFTVNLLNRYNDRIQQVNQRFGLHMPLATDVDLSQDLVGHPNVYWNYFSNKDPVKIAVPQFSIYKKSTNPLKRLMNFPGRIGFNPMSSLQQKVDQVVSKLRNPRVMDLFEGMSEDEIMEYASRLTRPSSTFNL